MQRTRTRECIEQLLLRDIATIVEGYIMPKNMDAKSIVSAGHWELCLQIDDKDAVLNYACLYDNYELAKLMIASGASRFDCGLARACEGGHKSVAELMIANGATNCSWGLQIACVHGHLELVKLMLANNPTIDINYGLYLAHHNEHWPIANFLITLASKS